ncbi:MAG: DUF2924 domain-containing protein [bacterium]
MNAPKPDAQNATPRETETIEAPTMTRDAALAAAREMWGARGDTVMLGASHFIGVQTGRDRWDWRGHGTTWEAAVADAKSQEADRKKNSAALKEKFGRIPVRIDGDTITREWHGKQYVVTRVEGGFEFAGTLHKSLTSIAKIVTGARAISGPRFFGVNETTVKS